MEMTDSFLVAGNALFLIGVTMRASRLRSTREFALALGLSILLGGAIGARLLFIVINRIPWQEGLSLLSAHRGGFSFLGAISGAAITLILFSRISQRPVSMLAGEIIPAWCLASIAWRLQCHFAGCCHGIATTNKVFTSFGILTHSGAPGQIPLPAVEITYVLLLTLWLYYGTTRMAIKLKLDIASENKLRISSYLLGYGLFRLIIEHWS